MMKYVLGFMFDNAARRVVLIQKQRPEFMRGKLNGVGGKIEAGESSLEAMIREFKEEAGVEVTEWRLFGYVRGDGFNIDLFCAFGDVTQVRTMTDELVITRHVGGDSIRALAMPNVECLIAAALNPKSPIITLQY